MRPQLRSPSKRDRRRCLPGLLALERREVPASAVDSLAVTPQVLSPPNERIIPVTVTGNVYETRPNDTPNVQYTVFDEYCRINLSGPVDITRISTHGYTFRFVVKLQARRANTDLNGRQYNVIVGTSDVDNSQGQAVTVLVPHNALRPGQTIKPYPVTHPVQSRRKLPPVNPPAKTSPLTGGLPFLSNLLGGLTGAGGTKKK